MGLTSVGIGSGMDINGIVSALVGAENDPKVAKFDADEGKLNAQISGIGALKSALTEFQDSLEKLTDPDTFIARKVELSNKDFISATADATAVAGSYKIEVEQLAESQKIGSAAVADATAALGEGSLTFGVDGKDFTVAVEAGDSLETVMKKINDAEDNVGVTATIINGDNGPQLVMTSDETGTANNITVTATDTDGGTGLTDTFTMTELSAAKDAVLYVDGLKVTSGSNEVENVITGVSLTLKDDDIGQSTTLTISPDTDSVKKSVEGFVEAYNDLMGTVSDLSSYDAETEKAGILQGDSMIRSLQSQLRGVLSSSFDTSEGTTMLANIGIKTTQQGTLEIDEKILDKALESDMPQIREMFSAEDTGLASRLDGLAETYVQSGGTLDSRDETLDNQVSRLTDSREQFARKMAAYETRLFNQFNAMDLMVASLNQQTSDLFNRLDSLPGMVPQN
ncbi:MULTISPECIES: flagellar filament capping protein FliD [unclassified Shewanella]|uniref:flagellar filament capping protein FliD n=1 Tax=unclassified Shewanella TaxID=196818 RepID=UPI001BB8B219|nr:MULTISPECIES: flagellar filament capping protein FliD [unclassified Shewanella]GIU09879.1 flagellar hook-associated protein 2 [Shewanella sp. MBTL60-112-B1]GIU37408.1 flagellar hook-associated protein 2 [Shewanella sp. MBTL60-112-B2]